MDKKDIYEHLAKIYLDASTKKRRKPKEAPRFKYLFFASTSLVIILAFVLSGQIITHQPRNCEIALVLQSDVAKINFNFNPATKEIYAVHLRNLNLARFKAVGFALKKANYHDVISLRVEFTNAFKEKSEIYLYDIPHRWKEHIIHLCDFKGINDWSEMQELAFTVEEWNTKDKAGVVYIDNVRLLR